MTVGVVALNFGNVSSVLNILNKIEYGYKIIRGPSDLTPEIKKIILPGVGHFDYAMASLIETGLNVHLKEAVLAKNTPILGICLGMQLLLDSSQEGSLNGLGLIPGKVKKIQPIVSEPIRIPHVVWRWIERNKVSKLYPILEAKLRFYFTHSFVACPSDETMITSTVIYGSKFCASLEHKNILGVQFHPEKSHKFGIELFKNFCEL